MKNGQNSLHFIKILITKKPKIVIFVGES
jgi:hypothetical protein